MNIQLRPMPGAAFLIYAAFCLSIFWPWLLSLPKPIQITACALATIALWRTLNIQKSGVHQLCFETYNQLSTVVGAAGKPLQVRSLHSVRLLAFYAEFVLQLDGGQRIRLFLWRGCCEGNAFRYLRNYLLKQGR